MKLNIIAFFCLLGSCYYSTAQGIDGLITDLKKALPSYTKIETVVRAYQKAGLLEFRTFENRINFFGLQHTQRIVIKFRDPPHILQRDWVLNPGRDTTWLLSRFRSNEWDFDMYAFEDTVVYLRFDEERKNEEFAYGTLVYYNDSAWAKTFVEKFNSLMKTSHTYDDCFQHSQQDYYGITWGFGFSSSEIKNPMKYVFSLVIDRDIDVIRRLCNSLSLETRAYGATAFFLLEKDGVSLEQTDLKIMQQIRRSKKLISFGGGGCIIYLERTADVLTDKYLKEIEMSYDWYKRKISKIQMTGN